MKRRYDMNMKSIACLGIPLAVMAGLLFWLTPYRYDRMTLSQNTILIRTSRFTGETEYFVDGEWKSGKISGGGSSLQRVSDLSAISRRAGLEGDAFAGIIYNGSQWTLTELTVDVVAKELNGKVRWERQFTAFVDIKPLSVGHFNVPMMETEHLQDTTWNITGARGFPPPQ